jgi:hypothetical protein
MWVRLTTTKLVSIGGARRTYRPGDWVDVGKHDALTWLAAGDARLPDDDMGPLVGDSGIMVYGGETRPKLKGKVPMTTGGMTLPYPQTLLLRSGACIRENYIPIGFFLIEQWEIAAPLYDYEALAATIGTAEEQRRTRDVIRDLRVPIYNADTVFVRRARETQAFMVAWQGELSGLPGGDVNLAFLRALYITKPLICALPVQWIAR